MILFLCGVSIYLMDYDPRNCFSTVIYILAFGSFGSFIGIMGIWDLSNGLVKYCRNYPIDKLSRQKKYEIVRQLQAAAVIWGYSCLATMAYYNSSLFMKILKDSLKKE